jgi:serine protease Do
MRKLGTWRGLALTAALCAIGLAGWSAAPVPAQEREVPWLGVVTQSLNEGLREGMEYEGEGVLITQVVDDGPADRAGVRKGDILVSLNSRSVGSPGDLTRMIRESRVGQSVTIVLFRDGRRRTVTPRLAERPERVDLPEIEELRDLPERFEHDFGPMMRWNSGEGDGQSFVFRGMGRGRLGVRLEDLGSDLGSYFDVPGGGGALVVEVMKDTPAERAGLKAGDVLTQIGDRKISDSDDVVEALRDAPEGKISITAVRKGASRTIEAELDEAPRRFRMGPGRDMMVLRPRDRRLLVPEVRREARREARRGVQEDQSLRELREELRELREKLDKLEGDRD